MQKYKTYIYKTYISNFTKKIILVLFFVFAIFQEAQAVISPRPIGNENRIKIINYMPNSVIRFVGHYMYHSIIEFAPGEEVKTITMGTPQSWQLYPNGNRIFLKPVAEDAATNMTIITNQRMYFFEMHAEYAESISDKGLVFMMKFIYPDSLNNSLANLNSTLPPPDLKRPDTYNLHYSISGPKTEIEPILIFDDGEFTYFKFRNVNAELPAFFIIDSEGGEGMVNYRISSGYVVVERVASKFTLRHGHSVICVFNEEYNDTLGQNNN